MFKKARILPLAIIVVTLGVIAAFAFSSRWTNVIAAFAPANNSGIELSRPGTLAPFTIGTCDTAGPVEVEATAGTVGPTAYATLKDAFDAINAGTHQGAINIDVCGNTTEAATASLSASGTGSASYTGVTIRPAGGARIIEGSIVGAVVKLNGADNVTIDGRQGGTGTARDLTIRNNSTSSATAAIWLASVAVGNGATNDIIRNLEVAAGQTATAGTNTTIGIYMGGTTISLTATDGNDNDNNQFIFNRVIRARYGIATRGVTTNNNQSPVITDNIIGPASFGSDEIGKAGIYMQADTGGTVSRNTVQFVGGDLANTTAGADRCGICIGSESWSTTDSTTITSGDYTVTRNIVHDIVEERTFSSMGIRIGTTRSGSPTNNLVANNFIYNVRADGTTGDQVVGIAISGGHTDKVVFNSISITGDQDPGASLLSTNFGSAIRVSQLNGTSHANLTLADNSIYLDASASTATTHFYAITANSAAYSFGTGFENNNNYYINAANAQLRTGGFSAATGAAATTEFQTLANWQAAFTAPQDANSIQADPLYVSTTSDLHIAMASPNVNAGVAAGGVVDDIDGQLRVGVPDIGADEPGGVTPPANDIAALDFVRPPNGILLPVGTSGSPQATFKNLGTATQTNVSVQFTIAGPGGFSYSDTQTIATIAPGQTVTVTFASGTFPNAGTYNMSAAVTTPDANPSNDVINGSFTAAPPLSGAYSVGSGGDFSSLTNPGGIFYMLNGVGATGNITINIVSDLTGETGNVALVNLDNGFSVTIKPSGGPRTITGSSAFAVIQLQGTENVTIDGSLSGGSATGVGGTPSLRNLTVQNTNTSATSGAVIAVMPGSANNSARNVVIKNVIISGQDPTQTLVGLHIGGSTIGAAPTVNSNNDIVVNNCAFKRSILGIFDDGVSAVLPATGNVLTNNDMTATGADRLRRAGIFFFNQNGILVQENAIGGIVDDESADAIGIIAGVQNVATTAATSGGVYNAIIAKNRISGVTSTSAIGFSAVGIAIAGNPAGPNFIGNNMISGTSAPSTSPDLVAGIFVAGVTGSNTHLFYNSIANTGDRGAVASQIGSYGVAISGTNPTVELKDNIFYTTQTSGGGANAKSYAIGMTTTTFTGLSSNYNDFVSTGANAGGFRTGSLDTTGTDLATLAAWQAATGGDANSLSVDPMFVNSATDPHILPGSPMINAGNIIAQINDDIDSQMRDATPDVGADEILGGTVPGSVQFSLANYSVGEGAGTVTLTFTRAGGTFGAISASFNTANGTATGGASCAAGVDYVTVTGGMVNWADGDATPKTATVIICNDSTFEADETFTAGISGTTGGASVGSPSTATVTITNDDIEPLGTVTVNDVRVTEGNTGGMNAVFTLTYVGVDPASASVQYATSNGTAIGGQDYVSVNGTVSFGSSLGGNQTVTRFVSVPIIGKTEKEANETFFLNLSHPVNVTISDSQGVGIIVDDDRAYPADFDRDRNSDLSVYRPSEGNWYIFKSTDNSANVIPFGVPTDRPVTGDYDGDGKADIAVYRPSQGKWFLIFSSDDTIQTKSFGTTGDKPVQGDYDGDGKTDLAVFRPSTGQWWIIRSSDSTSYAVTFGIGTDRPVQADYDGDFKTDIAVYRDGTWFIVNSSTGTPVIQNFGLAADKPVSGDFDGDGKYDLTVYRNGTWWVFNSLTGTAGAVQWGNSTDIPIPADYDHDGTSDFAVFRPSTGQWFVLRSSDGSYFALNWGSNGDIPIPSTILPQ